MNIYSLALVAALALAGDFAQAQFADQWLAKEFAVEDAEISQNGTSFKIPRSEAVVVRFSLQTSREYGAPGSRQVKSISAVPASGADGSGELRIQLQSADQFRCEPRQDGGISLAMAAPHRARASAVIKPGKYLVFIDDLVFGTLDSEKNEFAANPDYAEAVDNRDDAEFSRIFGPEASWSIALDPAKRPIEQCQVKIERKADHLVANYEFPEAQITHRNGDVLTKPAKAGSAELYFSGFDSRCEGNQLKYEYAKFRGRSGEEFNIPALPDRARRMNFNTGKDGRGCAFRWNAK